MLESDAIDIRVAYRVMYALSKSSIVIKSACHADIVQYAESVLTCKNIQ